MTIYARIDTGVVVEIIQPILDEDSKEIPVALRYHPDFVATLVDVTAETPMPADRWTAAEENGMWAFSAPASS